MDAQTRHQLKTNELSEWLASARLFVERRGWTIVAAVVAVVVVISGIFLWSASRRSAVDSAWQTLFEVNVAAEGDVESQLQELRQLATDAANDNLAATARYRLGCALLRVADQDAAKRTDRVNEAIRNLKPVLDAPDVAAPLAAAAGFSLGSAYENLRDFAQAKSTYETVASNARFAGSPFQGLAADRVASVDELKVVVKFEPGRAPPPPLPDVAPTSAPAAGTAPSSPPAGAQTGESQTPKQPEPPADAKP